MAAKLLTELLDQERKPVFLYVQVLGACDWSCGVFRLTTWRPYSSTEEEDLLWWILWRDITGGDCILNGPVLDQGHTLNLSVRTMIVATADYPQPLNGRAPFVERALAPGTG